jgi:hypothetical protein
MSPDSPLTVVTLLVPLPMFEPVVAPKSRSQIMPLAAASPPSMLTLTSTGLCADSVVGSMRWMFGIELTQTPEGAVTM